MLGSFGRAVVSDHVGPQTVARPTELLADGAVVAAPRHVLRLHVLIEVAAVAREVTAGEAGVAGLQAGAEASSNLGPDLGSRQ